MKIALVLLLVFLVLLASGVAVRGAPRAASKLVEADNWFRSNITRRSGQPHVDHVVNTIEAAPPGFVNHNSFFAPLLFSVVPPGVPFHTHELPPPQEQTQFLQVQHSPVNLFTYGPPKPPVLLQPEHRSPSIQQQQQLPLQQHQHQHQHLQLGPIPIVVDPVAYSNRYELDDFDDEVIIKERVLRSLLEGKFRRFKGTWPTEADNKHQYSRKRKFYAVPSTRTSKFRKSSAGKVPAEEDDEVQGPNLAENLYATNQRRERKENNQYSFRGERFTNGNIVVIIPKK